MLAAANNRIKRSSSWQHQPHRRLLAIPTSFAASARTSRSCVSCVPPPTSAASLRARSSAWRSHESCTARSRRRDRLHSSRPTPLDRTQKRSRLGAQSQTALKSKGGVHGATDRHPGCVQGRPGRGGLSGPDGRQTHPWGAALRGSTSFMRPDDENGGGGDEDPTNPQQPQGCANVVEVAEDDQLAV
jgi:hypothetical protein